MPKKPIKSRVPPLRVPLTSAQKAALASHKGPSKKSLQAIPEVDFENAAIIGRGDEGQREVLAYMRAKRGRPKKGEQFSLSTTRSLRLTEATWQALEHQAKQQHTTVHALLRNAVARELAEKSGPSEPARAPTPRRKRKTG
jgi:hypothetical protein